MRVMSLFRKQIEFKTIMFLLLGCVSFNSWACICLAPPGQVPFKEIDLNQDNYLTYAEVEKSSKTLELDSKQYGILNLLLDEPQDVGTLSSDHLVKSHQNFEGYATRHRLDYQAYHEFWENQISIKYPCGCLNIVSNSYKRNQEQS